MLTPDERAELLADIKSVIHKKEGKTWKEWYASLDRTKLAGWAMALFIAALGVSGTAYYSMKSASTPAPGSTPTPIRDELTEGEKIILQAIKDGNAALVASSTANTKVIVEAIKSQPTPIPPAPPIPPPLPLTPIVVEDTIIAEIGKMVKVPIRKADKASKLEYLCFPPTRATEVDADDAFIRVTAQQGGDFWYVAICSYEGRPAHRAILVKAGKGPQPPPEPPKPPTPPVPPVPTDPIAAAIFGAWQQEVATDKKDTAAKFALIYQAVYNQVPVAVTWGELIKTVETESAKSMIGGKLPVVSRAINDQLVKNGFPVSPSVLITVEDRQKAQTVLTKVITALQNLP